jgi:hypothetical protein
MEVDLIVERKGLLDAFEIKFAKTVSRDMAYPLTIFLKDHQARLSAVLSLNEKTLPLGEQIKAIHWSRLLKP